MFLKKQTDFYQQVYDLVKKIPVGQVVSYGQVASLLGKPRAGRLVGLALAACPADVPWYRVVNRQGWLSIENVNYPKELQKKLLTAEGVVVQRTENGWQVDIKKYFWQK